MKFTKLLTLLSAITLLGGCNSGGEPSTSTPEEIPHDYSSWAPIGFPEDMKSYCQALTDTFEKYDYQGGFVIPDWTQLTGYVNQNPTRPTANTQYLASNGVIYVDIYIAVQDGEAAAEEYMGFVGVYDMFAGNLFALFIEAAVSGQLTGEPLSEEAAESLILSQLLYSKKDFEYYCPTDDELEGTKVYADIYAVKNGFKIYDAMVISVAIEPAK